MSTSPSWRRRSGTSSRRSRGTSVVRLVGLDVVEVGPLLAADLEQVAEAVGGDQPGLRAAMLDQRIGRHRRAVAEIDDLPIARLRRDRRHPRRDARDGSSGVRHLRHPDPPASSSNRQISVNVPPESTPTRHRGIPPAPFQYLTPPRHPAAHSSAPREALSIAPLRRTGRTVADHQVAGIGSPGGCPTPRAAVLRSAASRSPRTALGKTLAPAPIIGMAIGVTPDPRARQPHGPGHGVCCCGEDGACRRKEE